MTRDAPNGTSPDNVLAEVHSSFTKNPLINVALEKPVYSLIEKLAEQRGLSLSMLTRDEVWRWGCPTRYATIRISEKKPPKDQ